mmetsp:Transcript_36073/g.109047  ORF Transcript_36073/g.109047 Transcript_36073/m.109047 type:complete len:230 (+) Transcript_36073:645-1334(+)
MMARSHVYPAPDTSSPASAARAREPRTPFRGIRRPSTSTWSPVLDLTRRRRTSSTTSSLRMGRRASTTLAASAAATGPRVVRSFSTARSLPSTEMARVWTTGPLTGVRPTSLSELVVTPPSGRTRSSLAKAMSAPSKYMTEVSSFRTRAGRALSTSRRCAPSATATPTARNSPAPVHWGGSMRTLPTTCSIGPWAAGSSCSPRATRCQTSRTGAPSASWASGSRRSTCT